MSYEAGYTETPVKDFESSAALAQHRRVRLDGSGQLAYASDTDTDCVGTMQVAATAASQFVPVWLSNGQGTRLFIASEAIARGGAVYADADGKVQSAGTVLVGEALSAATANNDQIEVLLSPAGIIGTVARASLTQEDLAEYPLDLTAFVVHDAPQTKLPGTAAADDLAIKGAFGTDAPTLQGVDFGGTTTTAYARVLVPLPPEYVAGQTITLRVRAGMLTTVADDSCDLDAEVHAQDDDGGISADICATAQQSINSLTLANKDFTITPTGRAAGDVLDIRLKIAGTDSGDAGDMLPEIQKASLLLDIKG